MLQRDRSALALVAFLRADQATQHHRLAVLQPHGRLECAVVDVGRLDARRARRDRPDVAHLREDRREVEDDLVLNDTGGERHDEAVLDGAEPETGRRGSYCARGRLRRLGDEGPDAARLNDGGVAVEEPDRGLAQHLHFAVSGQGADEEIDPTRLVEAHADR